jgi:arginine/lysine/ornithine decarboxylase
MPGEVITEAAIEFLRQVLEAGGVVSGCADANLQTLRVVKT